MRAIALLVVCAVAILGCSFIETLGPVDPSTPANGTGASDLGLDPDSGLPFVFLEELPPEATTTWELIDAGGPFPYDQDGEVFQNREGLLPARPAGYYREYTVETPGSGDRGARRIVMGADGERYWTDDHYDSFSRIER
ncbi:MAG TPA: ribonuclease domain-containing protein [Candidatus Limnocylindrales bacterium]